MNRQQIENLVRVSDATHVLLTPDTSDMVFRAMLIPNLTWLMDERVTDPPTQVVRDLFECVLLDGYVPSQAEIDTTVNAPAPAPAPVAPATPVPAPVATPASVAPAQASKPASVAVPIGSLEEKVVAAGSGLQPLDLTFDSEEVVCWPPKEPLMSQEDLDALLATASVVSSELHQADVALGTELESPDSATPSEKKEKPEIPMWLAVTLLAVAVVIIVCVALLAA